MNLQRKTLLKKYISFILPACLLIAFSFLATEKAFSQTSPAGYGITTGRAMSIATAVIGLISLVIGWRAKSHSAGGTGSGRSGAISALVLGIICVILSVVHLATATGGFGTGSGKAGAIVALVLGMIGMVLAALALRPKRA